MITINLKPGVRRQVQKGPAFGGIQERIKGLGTGIKEPWLAFAVGAWALVLIGLGGLFLRSSSQLSSLVPKLEETQAEQRRYEGFLLEKRRAERVRDSVLAQIGTISAVDRDRYLWPHILDEVANAVPDFTWLVEVAQVGIGTPGTTADSTGAGVAPPAVRIVGLTNDLQNYTAFLRRLEASPWLSDVMAVDAKTVVMSNRALTRFTLQASYSRADSTQIRTVPILESVVR
ncbi:MAG TPA: PilN domain-containing protein [Gemmatimonadales bacterium]|nr:PilN domain-containing protein [Gemmatimonadales bacterium]